MDYGYLFMPMSNNVSVVLSLLAVDAIPLQVYRILSSVYCELIPENRLFS